MHRPLTNILIKVFAKGFYKVNAGFLVFLFVTLISYCFFINTAGDVKLISKQQELYYHFILLINFVVSPLMTGLFFIAWIMYTLKSWAFVIGQLPLEYHRFIYYSSLSFSRIKQFTGWFNVQAVISLPFIFYALVASIVAILLHRFVIPGVYLVFIVLLLGSSAFFYLSKANKLGADGRSNWLARLSCGWRKPFYSLYIFFVSDRLKLTYVITKIISFLVIVGTGFAFGDIRQDLRVAGIVMVGVATTHTMLIFQQHRFIQTYLSIARNLPYSKGKIYLNFVVTGVLLLIPEIMWLTFRLQSSVLIPLLLLMLSVMSVFHCLLYRIGLGMNRYLRWVLGLFIVMFMLILFGFIWSLVALCFVFSYFLFYLNYYNDASIEGV